MGSTSSSSFGDILLFEVKNGMKAPPLSSSVGDSSAVKPIDYLYE
jgi:hypothetical protein